ncbi:hypothetical protein C1H46_017130 [Malus baccata]|uniref:Uncharacterized protein n=1 Tax=Malus baccata TaxID=106549 RepID=A0A540MFW0_MALBA|nr:hypothetical protein C1H46_017130 [Malus baccata]
MRSKKHTVIKNPQKTPPTRMSKRGTNMGGGADTQTKALNTLPKIHDKTR